LNGIRNRRFTLRRLPDMISPGVSIRGPQAFDILRCQWLAWLCCEFGLLPFKRNRRRWRRSLRHYSAIDNFGLGL
jgi:hypothetical protein